MEIFKKYIFVLVLFLQLLLGLTFVPYPEGPSMTPFDKCCRISEVSKLLICTCICTCNPTLKHFCPYRECISVPSHQKDQKRLGSTWNLKSSWSVSWRHFRGKKRGHRNILGLCTVTQEGRDRREHRTQDMSFTEGPLRTTCKTTFNYWACEQLRRVMNPAEDVPTLLCLGRHGSPLPFG